MSRSPITTQGGSPVSGRPGTDTPRRYEDCPEWEKALRTIVLAAELDCPPAGLALVARKALTDCGVPYEDKPL